MLVALTPHVAYLLRAGLAEQAMKELGLGLCIPGSKEAAAGGKGLSDAQAARCAASKDLAPRTVASSIAGGGRLN